MRARSLPAIGGALLVVAGILAFVHGTATADVPTSPEAAPFTAPLCSGQVPNDVTNSAGPVTNLQQLEGGRLDKYNAGLPVMLYDNVGTNEYGNIPVCVTRFVAGTGAVSEWSYCTDEHAFACNQFDADGTPLDHNGNPYDLWGNPMQPLAPTGNGNTALSSDQERIIAYLLQHPITPYIAPLGGPAGVTTARSDGTPEERKALQSLVWCISDHTAGDGSGCELSLPQAQRDAMLAATPERFAVEVFAPDEASTTPGDTEVFGVATDIFDRPITLSTNGASIVVCDDDTPATLDGDQLTVPAPADGVPVYVELCVTPAVGGDLELAASFTPDEPFRIGWNQSGTFAEWCQVYASFSPDEGDVLSDRASLTVLAPPTTSTTTSTTTTTTSTPAATATTSPSVATTTTAAPAPSTTAPGGGAGVVHDTSDRQPAANRTGTATGLSFTGGEALPLVLLGSGLVVVGVGVLRGRRR